MIGAPLGVRPPQPIAAHRADHRPIAQICQRPAGPGSLPARRRWKAPSSAGSSSVRPAGAASAAALPSARHWRHRPPIGRSAAPARKLNSSGVFAAARTRAHAENGHRDGDSRAGHGRVCVSAVLLASQKPSKHRGCRGITMSDKVQLSDEPSFYSSVSLIRRRVNGRSRAVLKISGNRIVTA
jgi:hypothetical protein